MQAGKVGSVDLGHLNAIDRIITVQGRASDVLALGVGGGGDGRRARLDGVDEVLVREVSDPREVEVEREQAPGTVRWVRGVGAVREDVRVEGLDVVGEEDACREHGGEVCAPELYALTFRQQTYALKRETDAPSSRL